LQKNIQDQVIEGLSDGGTIEDLLQESNLTLTATISKCQSREAAKKNRSEMANQGTAEVVAAFHKSWQPTLQTRQPACPGCGRAHYKGGRNQCPAYDQTCSFCHKVGHFARVCRSKQTHQTNSSGTIFQASTNAIQVQPQQGNYIQLYNMGEDKAEPAPTVIVHISSSTGTKVVEVLPDSGADI